MLLVECLETIATQVDADEEEVLRAGYQLLCVLVEGVGVEYQAKLLAIERR